MSDAEIWVEAVKCAVTLDTAYLAVSRPDGGFQYTVPDAQNPETLNELVSLAVKLYEVMRDSTDPFGALQRTLNEFS